MQHPHTLFTESLWLGRGCDSGNLVIAWQQEQEFLSQGFPCFNVNMYLSKTLYSRATQNSLLVWVSASGG